MKGRRRLTSEWEEKKRERLLKEKDGSETGCWPEDAGKLGGCCLTVPGNTAPSGDFSRQKPLWNFS